MVDFKVLIEGYAKEIKGGWVATSTTTLIRDNGKNVIVDPGTNRKLLLDKLASEGLRTDDINIVFLTHYHVDHTMLAGMFEAALVVDGETVYDRDKEKEYSKKIPGTDIRILHTPGHADEHTSLLIETKDGVVAVSSDLFWWMDNEKQVVDDKNVLIKRKDPFVKDFKALKESRTKILKFADWIVPGHGKMFRNPAKK